MQQERDGLTKCWLLADLETGRVEPVALAPGRRIFDLDPIDAESLTTAEVDAAIATRVAGVPGGIADAVVRLVARNVPRSLGIALDHKALRAFKATALHFQLDLRRPEAFPRSVGSGAPGKRELLPEVVERYLQGYPLDADLDRDRFKALGREAIDAVERALQEGGA